MRFASASPASEIGTSVSVQIPANVEDQIANRLMAGKLGAARGPEAPTARWGTGDRTLTLYLDHIRLEYTRESCGSPSFGGKQLYLLALDDIDYLETKVGVELRWIYGSGACLIAAIVAAAVANFALAFLLICAAAGAHFKFRQTQRNVLGVGIFPGCSESDATGPNSLLGGTTPVWIEVAAAALVGRPRRLKHSLRRFLKFMVI